MRSRRMAMVLAGGSALATLALAAPAQAASYEWDTATASSQPSGLSCEVMTGAEACYEANGDIFWVKDTKADGHSATASWYNHLWNGSQWVLYREGSCVNKLGAGHWGTCNKDFYESSSTNPYGYTHGSELEWYACVYDSADGTWHGCSGNLATFNP
jgi:hypothetical protein